MDVVEGGANQSSSKYQRPHGHNEACTTGIPERGRHDQSRLKVEGAIRIEFVEGTSPRTSYGKCNQKGC